ncbi:MAG TPA: TRAP transporter large permease subunit [Alphaproteobacteria bacterium]|jgi:tripartite ATP-independent transporter DctM subunit
MEWWAYLAVILALLSVFFLSGLPIAFSFALFNLIAVFFWMGGAENFSLLAVSAFASIVSFPLIAVPLFILMGELLFQSGVVAIVLNCVGKWLVGLRGNLALVAVTAGTLFGTMSGSAVSGVAVLGSTLAPEMRIRGYSKELSLGPILGSGCLAMIIPPSVLAVLLGSLGQIPVGALLISGVIPGVMLALIYAGYIVLRVRMNPALAPAVDERRYSWRQKLRALAIMTPILIVTLLIWGVLLFGVATPSEAAAIGVFGALVVMAIYRRLTWPAIRKSLFDTVKITGMIFLIIIGASAFTQILAYTGTTSKIVSFASQSGFSPTAVLIGMMLTMILLGSFLDELALLMISIPIYMPVASALAFDPIWFGLLMLLTLEIATISPPYGLALFVLKGVVPDASMGDVWKASIAYMAMSTLVLALIMAVPQFATWLPRALQ